MVRISHFTFTQKTIFHFAPNVFLHTCSQALKASLQIPLLCWFLSIRFIKFWLKYRWSLVKKKRRISRVALVYDSSPLCCALSQLALLPHHHHLRPSSFSFWYFSPLWTQLSQPECHRWWQCQGRGFVRWRTRDDDRIFASEEEIKENCPQVNNCWGSAAEPGVLNILWLVTCISGQDMGHSCGRWGNMVSWWFNNSSIARSRLCSGGNNIQLPSEWFWSRTGHFKLILELRWMWTVCCL